MMALVSWKRNRTKSFSVNSYCSDDKGISFVEKKRVLQGSEISSSAEPISGILHEEDS